MNGTVADVALSVIIVAYKSQGEIAACVGSLPRELNGGLVEVLVVDNSAGTPDEVASLLARRFPHVRVIDAPANLGFGRGNNLGYRASHGRCVLFLNPDTVCRSGVLEHCVSRVLADSSIGMISPRLVLADGSMDLACRRSIPSLWDGFCRASGLAGVFPGVELFAGYNLTHLPADGSYDVGAINGAFMLGRREVFERVAGPSRGEVFDERFFMYGDDLDLCIRMAQAGFRIVYDGTTWITHLKGVSVARDFDRMSTAIFDANRDVYLKHFNPRGSSLVRWRYVAMFGLWKRVALLRASWRGHRRVRPV